MVIKGKFQVIWDKFALDEFKEILTYLEKQSVEAPKIVKNALMERLYAVQKNPDMYELDKLKEPADNEFRAFVVFSFRLTYQVKADLKQIRILRIRHTRREPLGY